MKDLLKRISVALWGIPLLVLICYWGGVYIVLMTVLVNVLALWEFYAIFSEKDIHPYRYTGVTGGALFLLLTYYFPHYWIACLVAVPVVLLILYLRPQKGMAGINVAFSLTGFIYIPVLLSILNQLRHNFDVWMPETSRSVAHAGGWFIVIMFAAIWICDTAAYFGGKTFGKHKLAARISPNKTVEGAVLGFVFGILGFMLLGGIFLPAMPLWFAVVCGGVVGTAGQAGDLIESRFKRDAGVKDTSALLPGHGGFLDRFDSILFVSPFLWALCRYAGY